MKTEKHTLEANVLLQMAGRCAAHATAGAANATAGATDATPGEVKQE
jgi:hypothetical protein